MKSKKFIKSLSLLLVLPLLLTGCGKTEIEVKDGSKVAVSIDGGKITATEYYQSIKQENIVILIDLIDHQLLDEKYADNKEENEKVKEQINQLKNNYTDEAVLKQLLQQYFAVDTLEELEKVLRLEFKRSLAVKDYIKENLKDSEIEKYYNENIFGEVKASHILIPLSVSQDAGSDEIAEAEKEAKKTAEEVIKKLKDGQDFAKLAKKYSKDTASAEKGGDLGYFQLDDMVEEFSNAVKELKVKEYTKTPVKSAYGYHIILKTDEKEKKALKEVKDDIKEKLVTNKLNEDATLYYKTLIEIREKNNIKWNDTVLEDKYNETMKELIKKAEESAKSE